MKILGILGSSRPNGNTEILLEAALARIRQIGGQTAMIALRDLTIAPCNGCMGCHADGQCIIDDGMQRVYDEIRAADGVIWATPVYFWSMSGLTKMAMDRTYALGFPTLQQAGKIGGLILVAGIRGCINAANPFHMYFNYNHMFAAEYAWGYAGGKGDIRNNAHALAMTEEMASQMKALYDARLAYPREFDRPLHRQAAEKMARQGN